MTTPDIPDKLDAAVAQRLAKLGTLPIDTSHLDRALRAQIAALAPESLPTPAAPRYRFLRSFAAVAASLILVALVALALLQGRTVQASPDLMLQLHRDIVSGKVPSMTVDSVDEVNQAFRAFGQSGIQLSGPADMKPMACCMKDVGTKKVACILLNQEQLPVTLTVADLDAVKPLATPAVLHNGETFHVQSGGNLTMVTVDRGNHRICLIGQLSPDKLMTLTEKLKF